MLGELGCTATCETDRVYRRGCQGPKTVKYDITSMLVCLSIILVIFTLAGLIQDGEILIYTQGEKTFTYN